MIDYNWKMVISLRFMGKVLKIMYYVEKITYKKMY